MLIYLLILKKILNNNPLNAETQTEIEKFLHNEGIHILEDTKVLGVNINYLNNNVKVYCFDKSELFKVYLNKLIKNLTEKKNIESYINSRSINKKNDYHTFKIITSISKNDIINTMLYVFF